MTVAYLSKIESGQKSGSVASFRKLARALQIAVADLIP